MRDDSRQFKYLMVPPGGGAPKEVVCQPRGMSLEDYVRKGWVPVEQEDVPPPVERPEVADD